MTESWPLHTLVFDLDDTLYPERAFVLSGFRAVERWLGGRQPEAAFFAAASGLFAAGHRGRIFDEALAALGIDPQPALVAEMVAVYRGHEPELRLFSDAADLLRFAAPQFRLALITDGFAPVQRRKIRALGLEPLIPCHVVTDELGRAHWKPSPEPYRRVMARFPGCPEGYVYVGDNPRKDFLAPKQLGWRTVRVRRVAGEHAAYAGTADEGAELTVGDLREFAARLAPEGSGA